MEPEFSYLILGKERVMELNFRFLYSGKRLGRMLIATVLSVRTVRLESLADSNCLSERWDESESMTGLEHKVTFLKYNFICSNFVIQ